MKTSDLINLLMASVIKLGDREIQAEMQITDDKNEPLVGKRIPISIVTDLPDVVKLLVQFKGSALPVAKPEIHTEPTLTQ